MNKVTSFGKHNVARIEHVTRLNVIKTKVRPFDNNEQYNTTPNTNTTVPDSLRSISPECISMQQPTLRNSGYITDKLKTDKLSSFDSTKSPLFSTDNKSNLTTQTTNFGHRFINWFNLLTFKQKILFGLIVATIIISILAVAIIPPIYVFVIRRTHSESSSTNTTVSSCSSSTCIGQETSYRSSIVTALYPFDGNTNDQSSYYTGTAFGTSTPSYSTVAYVSQSIILSPTSQQYVLIPNINLSKQSFTLQTWLRPGTINTSTDFGIFSQCDSNSICMSLSLRNGRFVLSFDSMNSNNITLTGSSLVTSNEWVHVTVVYDATLYQQQIYVDGQIDALSNGIVNSYQGVSLSSTIIGRSSSLAYGTAYFQGRIDHFTITAGVARNACQISNDASLIVYYPFDTTGTYNDYSVNLCNGYASGTTIISSGHVNQAISFTSSTSYFESQCFPRMRGNEQSFSFSLWVNPNSTTGGGTLVHLSTNSNGNGTCYDLLVFTNTGGLICQWMTTTPSVSSAQGPVIPANTWTHIAVVYSSANGVRLFINGQFSTASSYSASLSLYNSNVPLYITLGNLSPSGSSTPVNCLSGSILISSGSFLGSIDEFRIYNRQLNNQEICVLANS
ncbi:unnamed protein product [Rotaria sordida]|uniref:Pentraxin (PTX) domain-containing protein n=2 Tax=Rotaria sordida TaxID=392033 RepID=A0A814PC63_9BILA|nr:unnamed protein product [Rotaria sordida]